MNFTAITRREWTLFLLMLVIVPLAGEPKFHPFSGDFASFRVSFGSPIFLLFLLWLHHFPKIFLGFVTGIAVTLFRGVLDAYLGLPLSEAIYLHLPTFFYYFCYALFFSLAKPERHKLYEQALEIAGWAIFAEVMASIAELSAMNVLLCDRMSIAMSPIIFARIFFIAILRCFFILSFFFVVQLYDADERLDRRTRERNRLTRLIAGLYAETFELHASLTTAEKVTHDCYNIYEELMTKPRDDKDRELAQRILAIAGECHDMKKTHQRIYTALKSLTSNKHVDDFLPPDQLAQMLVTTQAKYARNLGKDIKITTDVAKGLPPLHVFILLSILNNLFANAIEAIPHKGTIHLRIVGGTGDGHFRIYVKNTGSFIPKNRLQEVFHPGYTTKFDSTGKASSGVGLTYVKQQTEALGGTIQIDSDGKNTVSFYIDLPCDTLKKESVH